MGASAGHSAAAHRTSGRAARTPKAVWLAILAVALAWAMASAEAPVTTARAVPRPPVITFYFGLKRPEARAVAAFLAIQQPGSRSYRRFLTPGRVGRLYGASSGTKRSFLRVVRRLGLSAQIDPSGVFARVSGTESQIERAFRVRIRQQFDNDSNANSYFVPGGLLRLPRVLRALVREVVPDFAHSTKPPKGASGLVSAGGGSLPGNSGTWTGGCHAAQATGGYSFEQIRHAYGLDAVGAGAGASVAVLNDEEGVIPRDVSTFARCFGLPGHRVRTLLTDGQTRPFPPVSFEPTEDMALARGIAPQLSSLLPDRVWGTPALWFLGPSKLLTQSHLPDALSISYGYCEAQILGRSAPRDFRSGASLLNSMFVRLGLAGVSAFASAGDFGSTCNGVPHPGVAWPGSSSYVTSVGGTRLVLDAANNRVDEVVWNDLQWLPPNNGGGAGGGGVSAYYARPAYQRAVPLAGTRRMVPDVSAHASTLPGYPVVLGGNWLQDAGTSAAARLVAAAFADVSAAQRGAGRPPLGPVDGLIYWLEQHDPSAMFDVVSGSNGYNRKVPARFAGPGYDLASGIGVPRFDQLGAVLPPPAR
jgi:subtilase family serine protease